MKKIIFSISFIAIFSIKSLAQWTDNGDNMSTPDKIIVGASAANSLSDRFYVNTGGQYFRVMNSGIGVVDSGWRNTFVMSNNFDYHELYSNQAKPIIFQLNDGGVAIGTNSLSNYRFVVRQKSSSPGYGLQIQNAANDKSAQFWVGTGGAVLDAEGTTNLHIRTAGADRLFIKNSGQIGIGTTDPGNDLLRVSTGDQYFRVMNHGIGVVDSGWRNTFVMSNNFDYHELYSNQAKPIVFQNYAGGSVGIGTTVTGTHRLAVDGSIGAREIKVEASGWSDFVFENDYDLRTLEEVEEHINKNGHLPEIPSATEVTENGINLGEMNAKLLQKIEELTLYLIEQNKQNKTQQEQLEAQSALIDQLKKEVSALKNE